MNEENKPLNEPSMEEILASIRRIISEDEKNDSSSKEMESEKFTVKNKELFESTEVVNKEESLIEELAKKIMKPMIKEWLGNNLPLLVERAVSLEIERLSKLGKENE